MAKRKTPDAGTSPRPNDERTNHEPATDERPDPHPDAERGVRESNIAAGAAIAETVRTTLGPRGLDKLLVDSSGMGTVTNNGASLLRELRIVHPAARMVAQAGKEQEDATSDGTTTAVVLAGALLENAADLLERGLHPATIVRGYGVAFDRATTALEDAAVSIDAGDDATLEAVAATAISGKGATEAEAALAELVVETVRSIEPPGAVGVEDVAVEKIVGERVDASALMRGVILSKERANNGMPYYVEEPSIAIFDTRLGAVGSPSDVALETADAMDGVREREGVHVEEFVERLESIGADVVVTGEKIEDALQRSLAAAGIYGVQYESPDALSRLATATDGRVVGDPADVSGEDLGSAKRIAERQLNGGPKTAVEETATAKAPTLVLRGGTRTVIDEVHRAIQDALKAVDLALEDGRAVVGAGAVETTVARDLRRFARGVGYREQLAVQAYADALETVPELLARNAGYDPVDTLAALRSEHDRGNETAGVDVESGGVLDARAAGVLDPFATKYGALERASEVAGAILRIDDLLGAGEASAPDEGESTATE